MSQGQKGSGRVSQTNTKWKGYKRWQFILELPPPSLLRVFCNSTRSPRLLLARFCQRHILRPLLIVSLTAGIRGKAKYIKYNIWGFSKSWVISCFPRWKVTRCAKNVHFLRDGLQERVPRWKISGSVLMNSRRSAHHNQIIRWSRVPGYIPDAQIYSPPPNSVTMHHSTKDQPLPEQEISGKINFLVFS